jgi:hypothetical protein
MNLSLRAAQIAIAAFVILVGHCEALAQVIGVSWSDTNSRVFKIDRATGAGQEIGLSGTVRLNSLAENSAGKLYSVGGAADNALVTINPTTGAATVVATLTSNDIRGLAFTSNDTLYGILNGGSINTPDKLVTINVNTGTVSLIGSALGPGMQALDFSPAGVLYGWDVNGAGLVTINTTTGAATDVNPSIGGSTNVQGLAFAGDGSLYGAADNFFYTINVATGAATLVGTGSYTDIRGLAILVPEPNGLGMALLFFATLLAKTRCPRVSI